MTVVRLFLILLVPLLGCNNVIGQPDSSEQATSLLHPLPASFAGDLPCADCVGIRWHLGLQADGSYQLRLTYLGKTPEIRMDAIGRWRIDTEARTLNLSDSGKEQLLFRIINPDRLEKLDLAGKPITSKHNHTLLRQPSTASLHH